MFWIVSPIGAGIFLFIWFLSETLANDELDIPPDY